MTICERFSTVVVPFPFVELAIAKPRPALVLSTAAFNRDHGQSILAMITSASRSFWPSDTYVGDLALAGLRTPSVIRLKLFTVPNALIDRRIGQLGPADADRTAMALRSAGLQ